MNRIDDSVFLLYIEPRKEEKRQYPINDEITKIMDVALSEAKAGTSNYSNTTAIPHFSENSAFKGFHSTDCGMKSSTKDYLLKNGMITNSLCVYYLQYYRNSIPQSEMNKVYELIKFYKK